MKSKYCFPVSRQANLLGLAWTQLCRYGHAHRRRFEEKKFRTGFFPNGGVGQYVWSAPPAGTCAAYGRFMSYFAHETLYNGSTLHETYLDEAVFATQQDRSLAQKLVSAESALVEFLGMHPDGCRFFGRDLSNGFVALYSPHDHMDWWQVPLRPRRDSCLMQVYRLGLESLEGETPEFITLTTPTLYAGSELRARSLTCLRLYPGHLPPEALEKKIWQHAHWTDFCVDRPPPSERYLQALARWGEYMGQDVEHSASFGLFLSEISLGDLMIEVLVSDLDQATVAIPELEWVLETLWNEQPRVTLWGNTPKKMKRHLCSQRMLNRILEALKRRGIANILPRHVIMARSLA